MRGRNYHLCFSVSSEDQDELHCQDTDSDVPEQRDSRCKVKWTQEEVSESLVLAESRSSGVSLWRGTQGLVPPPTDHDAISCCLAPEEDRISVLLL